MDDAQPGPLRFEPFRLDPRSRVLRRDDGGVVPLTGRAFDTLCYLVRHRDRVVGKDELFAAVWAGRVVEENNLSQAVSAIRRALGTGAQDHRFLVTVPGRGYRFVAEVAEVALATADVAPASEGAAPPPGAPAPELADRRGPPLVAWLGAVLFLVALFVLAAWHFRPGPGADGATAPTARPATLAILPFRSLAPGAPDDVLELGLADTLVTRLARVDGLRVRALPSSLAVPRGIDAVEAGRLLDANYVVTGSAQQAGGRVRVNARLVSVGDGRVIWTQTIDTDGARVFAAQDRIAAAIAERLSLQPEAMPVQPPSPCDGGDVSAYRAVLRAQYRLHRRDPSTIGTFHEAIRRDPTCARAYAGLAVSYMFQAHNDAAPLEVFPLARAAIDRALALDPDAPETLLAHARYLQLHAWDWAGSERALRRALAINPSLADGHFALAHLLVTHGRFDEGLSHARQARELDPLSPFINALEAGFLTAAGETAGARVRVARALELEPDFWIALLVRGGMALDGGEPDAAVRDLARAAEASGGASQVLALLAIAHAAAGDDAAAAAIRDELVARSGRGYLPGTSLAAAHLATGAPEAALDALEQARAARDIRIVFMGVDARWNPLRDSPRFRALAGSTGLSADAATGRF
ncbi:hypothetical protein GCM10028862_19230 [Luteimonas pelagia]